MTATEFCTKHGIIANVTRTDSNPSMENSRQMDHWRVTLERYDVSESGGLIHPKLGSLTTTFSKGFGHKGKAPTAAEVMECLVMDASPFAHDSLVTLEDWCNDFGYDPDSRKAERIFNLCREGAVELRSFLGRQLFYEVTKEGLE